jgi:alpha-L-rhamnosidase
MQGMASHKFLFALLTFVAHPSSAQVPVGSVLQQSFIWPGWIPAGSQAYVAFRQNFTLQSRPSQVAVHVFADSRYMLWINGEYVLRGPCRFNPKRPEYDTVDITSYASAGENSVVVLVHTYGNVINGRIMSHTPGLTALVEADNSTVLQSGPSWRCSNETEYRPSPEAWSSIPDVLDAGAPVQGWTAPGYDDSAWDMAEPVNGSAWGPLFPRAMPLTTEAPLDAADLLLMPAGSPLGAVLPLTLSAGQSIVVNLGRMAMVYANLSLYAPAAGAVLSLDYALRYVDGSPRETYGAGSVLTTRAGVQQLFGGDQWCSHYMLINVQVIASAEIMCKTRCQS